MLGISPVKCHLWNPAVLQPFAWQNVTGGSVPECAVQCECNMCWTLCGLPCRARSSCYVTPDFWEKLKTYLLHPSIFNHPVSSIFHHLGLIMRWQTDSQSLKYYKTTCHLVIYAQTCLLEYTRSWARALITWLSSRVLNHQVMWACTEISLIYQCWGWA